MDFLQRDFCLKFRSGFWASGVVVVVVFECSIMNIQFFSFLRKKKSQDCGKDFHQK